jgi:tetratricopeptide (TPR) repeat protein
MKIPSSIVAVSLLCIASALCETASAADARADACEALWLDQSGLYVNRAVPDYQGLLNWWESKEKKCAGTVTYEARLAYTHIYLDHLAEARRILDGIKDKKSPYYYMVEWIGISADLFEIDSLPAEQQEAAFGKGFKALQTFTRRYPDKGEGFAMLGSMQLFQDDLDGALQSLETALRLVDPNKSKSGIYRNLTLIYARKGRYSEAIDAGHEALTYSTSFQGDPQFMYSLIQAHAGLGLYEEVDAIAGEITTRVPNVKSDDEFQKLMAWVDARRNTKLPRQ